MGKRKKATEAASASNCAWAEYFEQIQVVCPWSLAAWRNHQIEILPWRSTLVPLGAFAARIYTAPHHSPRLLKKISDRLNQTQSQDEWLWSHPRFKYMSAPVACLIQQDRAKLVQIRQKTGYYSQQ